jgi:hypothetical protein
MEKTYMLVLSSLQIEILLDMVRGFVDNKKLLHVPTSGGDTVGLPLTEEALVWLLDTYEQANEEKSELKVTLHTHGEKTNVSIAHPKAEQPFTYEVNLGEFSEN